MYVSRANVFYLIKADTLIATFQKKSTSTEIFSGGKYITKSLLEYNSLLTINMF